MTKKCFANERNTPYVPPAEPTETKAETSEVSKAPEQAPDPQPTKSSAIGSLSKNN